MKKFNFFFGVAIFATVLLTSCGGKCDKNDPESECYEAPALTTDTGVTIDGIKWATRNVDKPGTFAATPESAGMFYQWNRKIGWTSSDPMVSSDAVTMWSSYDSSGTSWTSENDPCPTGWRVPTKSELDGLLSAEKDWTTTPANGRIFGSGANTIFLSAAGYRHPYGGTLHSDGSGGCYWSSSNAYYVYFNSNNVYQGPPSEDGASGYSVRCVAE